MAAIFASSDTGRIRGPTAVRIMPIRANARRRRAMNRPAVAVALAVTALMGSVMLLRTRPAPSGYGKPADAAVRQIETAGPALMASPGLPETPREPGASPIAAQATIGGRAATGQADAIGGPAAMAPGPVKAVHVSRPATPARRERVMLASYVKNSDDCDGTIRMDRARCMHPRIVAADDVLRSAYAGAVRAGVSRRTLSHYRARWARFGRKTLTDPDRVVAEYREMSRDLRDLGQDAKGAGREYIADAS
ncbi:hypothetical protein [Sphingomonas sp.]|uniref:hypothetical protein n=1 Tax=Sphingomonas sp. TaxID=28214 RepID=UPI000DB46B8E|nr:hypothetical protein [Sphingomonas sp.]PZU08637.1 MAG: hypothetical protein DI605_11850 [Sphingomonas sp.]